MSSYSFLTLAVSLSYTHDQNHVPIELISPYLGGGWPPKYIFFVSLPYYLNIFWQWNAMQSLVWRNFFLEQMIVWSKQNIGFQNLLYLYFYVLLSICRALTPINTKPKLLSNSNKSRTLNLHFFISLFQMNSLFLEMKKTKNFLSVIFNPNRLYVYL